MSNVLVVAEIQAGKLRKATLPTISFAQKAADALGGEVYALVLDDDASETAAEVAKYGVDKVLTVEDEAYANYLAETTAPVVAQVAREHDIEVVCGPSSAQGSDYLPRVAQALEAGMVTNGMDVWDEDGLKFKRPMWSGSVFKTVEITTPTKVVSVRTTDFDDPEASDPAPIEAIEAEVPTLENVEHEKLDLVQSERPELTDADVVSAMLEELRRFSPGGAEALIDERDAYIAH
ncbi:MAG: hypothetical protein ABEK29_03535, partial [Bradymonadaceae bacterium]